MVDTSFKSDYKSIEELFSSSLRYKVPPYQRDFSWNSTDQIVDFWSDITESVQTGKEHFFGNILLRKTYSSEDCFDILDGQQRLATVTILLAVIRDKLNEIGDFDRSKIVQQSIASHTDVRTLKPVPRLTLNLRNKEFFFDYIQRDDSGKRFFEKSTKQKQPTTNKLIVEAYNYFQKEIEKRFEPLQTKEAKARFLAELSYHISKSLTVIETRVGSTAEAYRLFMPLNSRGLDLSVADLFKSHIIEESPKENKDDVITIWSEIAYLLDDIGIVNFLRHYWASRIATVAEKDLYDEFVKLKGEKTDLVQFIKELREEAEVYNALSAPPSDYWVGRSSQIPPLLDEIKALNIKQCLPLLLIGRSKFSDREFVRLLQTCINFSFRFSTIMGQNTKNIERLYGRISIELSSGKISSVDAIIAQLKKEYPNDERFLLAFKEKELTINKVARYILTKIEDSLAQQSGSGEKTRSLTLEHILPEQPDGEWVAYLEKKKMNKDEWVSRIGNMTLLTEKMNSNAKSKSFIRKRDEYFKNSTLKLNQNLVGLVQWDGEEIAKRQAWLAEQAVKIWRLD
jgi:uncharacterized protein with ParB-like and HNH nuclease domain